MKEDAFYDRLREGFNDVFLTLGVDGNPEQSVLSYEHFPQRLWYQKFDLSHIKDEAERRRAGYKLASDYRTAIMAEPMKLVEHIVRNDRPFTEIVTADYAMVSPYTARGYGIFEQMKDKFKNPEDPLEFIPVKLRALTRTQSGTWEPVGLRDNRVHPPRLAGRSSFRYLCACPTTETNRNRLRARMYYQHFLGVDVLELAAGVLRDAAAAVTMRSVPVPTHAGVGVRESADVQRRSTRSPGCSRTTGGSRTWACTASGRAGGSRTCSAPASRAKTCPPRSAGASPSGSASRTSGSRPRFAVAMTEHVYWTSSP